MGSLVSFLSDRNTLEKGEILCSGQESNRGFSVVLPIAWPMYPLHYPGSYLVKCSFVNIQVYLP